MVVYIAGPITSIGDTKENLAKFCVVEERLRAYGHTPINPAKLPVGLKQRHYIDICMAMLRSSESIYLLPDWDKSKGAVAEHAYSEVCGIPIFFWDKV